MIRFLADENFNGLIVRGLLRRQPGLDVLTAVDAELGGADDPTLLQWAAEQNRLILTHDARTLAGFAYERVKAKLPMSGVVEVATHLPLGAVIEDLLLIAEASAQSEWEGQIIFLPL